MNYMSQCSEHVLAPFRIGDAPDPLYVGLPVNVIFAPKKEAKKNGSSPPVLHNVDERWEESSSRVVRFRRVRAILHARRSRIHSTAIFFCPYILHTPIAAGSFHAKRPREFARPSAITLYKNSSLIPSSHYQRVRQPIFV